MDCIENFIKELDQIEKRTISRIRNINQTVLPTDSETYYIPKDLFNWKAVPVFFDNEDEIKMIKCFDGVYRAKEVKSNVTLVKWWHFNWLMKLQVKLFGRCLIY